MTMSYIVVVNPAVLKGAGIPAEPSMVATMVTAIFGTLFMGIHANRPCAIAPYMGENAFLPDTFEQVLGFRWQTARAVVLWREQDWCYLSSDGGWWKLFRRLYATASLIIVGRLMLAPASKIPFHDFTELIPAFAVVTRTSFTYNVAVGIIAGFVLFRSANLFQDEGGK
jgi:xanthine/uracil/vitamin C permease (AzgA family)